MLNKKHVLLTFLTTTSGMLKREFKVFHWIYINFRCICRN